MGKLERYAGVSRRSHAGLVDSARSTRTLMGANVDVVSQVRTPSRVRATGVAVVCGSGATGANLALVMADAPMMGVRA